MDLVLQYEHFVVECIKLPEFCSEFDFLLKSILHSAAKSKDVKMIAFILQKISPSTQQKMFQMQNDEEQAPSDYLSMAPSIHSLFPLKFRQVVKAVLMLGAKRQDETPYYPQTHFYKLFIAFSSRYQGKLL
jgi:hypothetical protein